MKLRVIGNDPGPIGLWKYPASEVPRQLATATVPVRWPLMGYIALPQPMTDDEWNRVMEFMALIRDAYVVKEPQP